MLLQGNYSHPRTLNLAPLPWNDWALTVNLDPRSKQIHANSPCQRHSRIHIQRNQMNRLLWATSSFAQNVFLNFFDRKICNHKSEIISTSLWAQDGQPLKRSGPRPLQSSASTVDPWRSQMVLKLQKNGAWLNRPHGPWKSILPKIATSNFLKLYQTWRNPPQKKRREDSPK